ncbi:MULTISPECIES: HofP DNA utilization family protein [Tenebrionibacter/Tenebrionicola group]|jgi:hypothetical protein|uniref:DUF2531 family protein n=2 Tax=Tenebrionibacter/Tenebrionicola group TaxID=2969848 RepID=A0A8K0V8E4_9ENTR|nr:MULTISPECIES: HofP DNA utilization family protein [Tenebrionibacter/Tenebrionicola group]MBK4716080.1 DUF2531 family protein [Tenebrionibacter intestinalis]MBV5095991.1 DUF2531 family protein [Tenebrionicola larvae]
MKAWLLALMIALPCQAARNPFIPVTNPCESPFKGWTLRGMARSTGGMTLAVINTPGGWVRFRQGDEPRSGWRIERITENGVYLHALNSCKPVNIRREEKGEHHDRQERHYHAVAVPGAGGGAGAERRISADG